MPKKHNNNHSNSNSNTNTNTNNYRFIIGCICVTVLLNIFNRELSTTIASVVFSGSDTPTSTSTLSTSTLSTSTSTTRPKYYDYVPSKIEKYIMDNRKELGYDPANKEANPAGCSIWSNTINDANTINDNNTNTDNIKELFANYSIDLDRHTKAINDFQPIPNLLKSIINKNSSSSIEDICSAARPHPDGLKALFSNSNELSFTPNSGYVEPLYPPMRHHKFCENRDKYVMSLDYLVHDFESMCLQLKPHSKIVLIDIGASLSFHGNGNPQPIVTLLELYEKFGFHFDHIYGFEITFSQPQTVFEKLLPERYMHNYHWINVGVDATEGHKLNPLNSILKKFTEDDLIVVKLDIDTSSVEVPLAYQILKNTGSGKYNYHKLIDQFYFEHHIHMKELERDWGRSMNGTISDTLELFSGLRSKGIPAHFWP